MTETREASKRIVVFAASLEGGGAERVMVILANNFARLGFETVMVIAKPVMDYQSELSRDIRLVNLRTKRMWRTLLPLARFLKRNRPDAMLSTLSEANIVALLARQLAGVPKRVIVREANTPSLALLQSPSLKKRLSGWLLKWVYRLADSIVAVSEGVRHDLVDGMSLNAHRVVRIFNPVPIVRVRQLAQEPVDHPWFLPGQPPIILGVGRLSEQKDFSTLLKAFAQVRLQRMARLVILGEGEARASLESLAKKLGIASDVCLPGFDPNPFRYMQRASVFALSSRYEGLPNVLIQAMVCGCPVVSTDCPSGPRDILDGGRYGFLVPVGDAEAMAKAILKVLAGEHPTVHPEWLEQFDESYVVQQYLKLLFPDETILCEPPRCDSRAPSPQ